MWLEILLCVIIITCWFLTIVVGFASRWWHKVRDNYRALRPLTYTTDGATWQKAMDAADDFRNNPPWYVKILTPSEWRNPRPTLERRGIA